MTISTQQDLSPELDSRNFSELEKLIGHQVVDKENHQVGTVDNIWEDSAGEPALLTVKTGWFGLGKTLIIPTEIAHLRPDDEKISVPYSEEVLRQAPTFDADHDLDFVTERKIYEYFAQHGFGATSTRRTDNDNIAREAVSEPATPPPLPTNTGVPPLPRTGIEENSIILHKEKLVVGKREVVEGGVRLRKVVRSEIVSASVELLHEELVIDRVPADRPTTESDSNGLFQEQEIYIPLKREELVIGKETVVTGEVHAGKESFIEKKDISDTVRTEAVELVDDRHDAKVNAE